MKQPLIKGLGALVVASFLLHCGGGESEEYPWQLPTGFPVPEVPADNPMNDAKVALGRRLFYDKRLSGNETQACGSCHLQEHAFTDGRAQALGSTGEITPRSSMSLTNVAYNSAQTWANRLIRTLEAQALLPMFGEDPVELGLAGLEDTLIDRLRADPEYQRLFPEAFSDADDAISLDHVVKAIAAFERTLISGNSAYDRFVHGDATALSDTAKRGMDLFFSEKLECFHCHGGFNFANSVASATTVFREAFFHNTGLYNLDGNGAYPPPNRGLFEVSQDPQDMGLFRAPTLRNIALTAPYMHDGSVATLDEAIDHYANGGRNISEGEHLGDGSKSPKKSPFMVGFVLSADERADLKAFLHSLTDHAFVQNPMFSDPFEAGD